MQKIILDTKALHKFIFEDWDIDATGSCQVLEKYVLQALTKSFEAGQKSREKEIVEILQSVETIAEDEQKHHFTEHCPCLRYAIYKVENPDAEEMAYASSIKSLSLTKESK